MKRFLLVDGNSISYRAFYATSYSGLVMKSKDGFPTNALYTFSNMTISMIKHFKPTHIIYAFDHGKKTLRHEALSTYKGNRKSMPSELVMQMPLIREFLNLIGIYNISIEGIEADDVIGTCSKTFSFENNDVVIVSSDNDMLQLVNKNTRIMQPIKGANNYKEINLNNFEKEVGNFSPASIPEVKGLMGDSSDNIPGIKGIGKKGAYNLITKYQTLENIYSNRNLLEKRLKNLIETEYQTGLLSRNLATIDKGLQIDHLNEQKVSWQFKEIDPVISFCKRYNLERIAYLINEVYFSLSNKIQ